MRIRRIILLGCLLLSCAIVFLPFRSWESFELPETGTSLFQLEEVIEYETGFEMIIPLFTLPMFVLALILVGYVRTRITDIITLIFIALNGIFLFQLYQLLLGPVFWGRRADSFQVGSGFYLLCITTSVIFVVTIASLARSNYRKRRIDSDLIDSF
jgi:hypothetical protein